MDTKIEELISKLCPDAYMTYKGFLYHAHAHSVSDVDDYNPRPLYGTEELELFADLIIKECIGLCDDELSKTKIDNGMRLDGNPKFKPGERVFVLPLKVEATVIKQRVCYDGPESFWGNVELIYDDGAKGVSNSWQLRKLTDESTNT